MYDSGLDPGSGKIYIKDLISTTGKMWLWTNHILGNNTNVNVINEKFPNFEYRTEDI